MFQRPPSIPGLKLGKMLEVISPGKTLKRSGLLCKMNMDEFVNRISTLVSGGDCEGDFADDDLGSPVHNA